MRKLSQGMKQKAAVVCALAKRTPVVFLDEPTLGLDVETSYELRRTLKRLAEEEDRAIVLSSHNMDVVQDVCSRVIIVVPGGAEAPAGAGAWARAGPGGRGAANCENEQRAGV